MESASFAPPVSLASRFVAVLALFTAASFAARAASARLERVVETQAVAGNFSGTVLVAQGDTPLLDHAWGQANIEWGVPNSPTTRFRIGSITKQFTAAAILLLEERGQLKTSDPLSLFIPEAPPAWAPLTLDHLLTHTSGVPSFTAFPEFRTWKHVPTNITETMRRIRDRPLDFAPGAKFAYSNSNYLLLGYVIERVTGMDYATFLRLNILEPLGLRDTGVDADATLVPRRATGYMNFLGEFETAPHIDATVPHAAGAMYSTTHDLHRWIRALVGGKLLSPAALAKMLTPVAGSYAYGIRVYEDAGRRVIEHGGTAPGFAAQLRYYPDAQLTVVVLSNVIARPAEMPLLARMLARTAFDETDRSPTP